MFSVGPKKVTLGEFVYVNMLVEPFVPRISKCVSTEKEAGLNCFSGLKVASIIFLKVL